MIKKILLVTRPIAPPWDEASKNFAYNLATNMPDFEFGLLTNGILDNVPQNIKQYPIYNSNKNNFIQKLRLIINLKKISRQFEIVHCLFTPTKVSSFLLSNLLNNKKSKTIQTIATLREDLYSNDEIKKLMLADKIITYSKYAKKKLNNFGLNNIEQIYPGIDLEEYQKKERNNELMQKYNFSDSDFIINFTGEYFRLGAINDVVDSFIGISGRIENAKLSLAVRVKNNKDAEKKTEIIEKLKKAGLLDRTTFHDDGSYKMSDIYNLCDVSLFPVREMHGKFDVPLAVVEAMACEKPVIVSDLPILSEFAKPEHSVIIERGNIEQLKSAILDLYDNPDKRMTIGRNARKFVAENFDIKKAAQNYREIYNGL